MKSCHNCRAIHADDYAGTCTDCGAGLGGEKQERRDLRMQWASQVSYTQREGDNPRSVNPEGRLVNLIKERYVLPEQ